MRFLHYSAARISNQTKRGGTRDSGFGSRVRRNDVRYRFPFMPARTVGEIRSEGTPAKSTLLYIGVNPSLNREILRFSPFTSAPQYGNYSSNLPGALASGGERASYPMTESKWAGLGSQMACRWSGCSHGASAPATLYSPGKISHIDGPHGALHAWLSRRSGRRTTRSLR